MEKALPWIAGGLGLYFLVVKPQMAAASAPVTAGAPPVASPLAAMLNNFIPSATPIVPVSAPVNPAIPGSPSFQLISPYASGESSAAFDTANQLQEGVNPVVANAPALVPVAFNINFYLQYQYPALIAFDKGILSPTTQLNAGQGTNYTNNYPGELNPWLKSVVGKGGQFKTTLAALQYHWTNYGPVQYRSYVPFHPVGNGVYVAPPKAKKSSSVFGDILKGVTAVAGAAAIVVSAGALTPIVVPAEGVALSAESQIHGVTALPDNEIEILINGAAIMIEILPFYKQAAPLLVNQIYNRLYQLLGEYGDANETPQTGLIGALNKICNG